MQLYCIWSPTNHSLSVSLVQELDPNYFFQADIFWPKLERSERLCNIKKHFASLIIHTSIGPLNTILLLIYFSILDLSNICPCVLMSVIWVRTQITLTPYYRDGNAIFMCLLKAVLPISVHVTFKYHRS